MSIFWGVLCFIAGAVSVIGVRVKWEIAKHERTRRLPPSSSTPLLSKSEDEPAASSPYREPAASDDNEGEDEIEDEDKSLMHDGPQTSCPACGIVNLYVCDNCGVSMDRLGETGTKHICKNNNSNGRLKLEENVTHPEFCEDDECEWVGEEHLHQNCKKCRADWTCAPLNSVRLRA